MANTLACTSTSQWIWVVEALASSDHVDASLLIDLFKRIVEISDDTGKCSREMVSLRILENLFTNKNGKKDDTSLAVGPKISFDPSERCEDVLQKILQEISASKMKISGPEMLKWDIQSFVTYKKYTFPQCALLQIKNKMVKSTDPRLAPLKKRSGLSTTDQSGNFTSADGIACNGTAEMREESNFKHLAQNGNLVASTMDNGNNQKETLPDRDLLSSKKRKRNCADDQGRESPEERSILENDCDPCIKVTKKCKQTVAVDKDCEHITEITEKEGCNLENESHAGGLGESGSPFRQSNDGRQQHHSSHSEMPQRTNSGGGVNLEKESHAGGLGESGSPLRQSIDGRQQHHSSHSEMPQRTNSGGGVKSIYIDSSGEEGAHAELRNSNDETQPLVQRVSYANETERNFPHNLSNGGPVNETRDNIDCFHEPQPCSDNDEYHEERIKIASKKTAFLSSQCTCSQDSFATTDLRELNLCMKCNRGGELLVCSSETCPLVVHDSCLGSIPNFEKDGRFYCPFCAYSRAILEYKEVQKKESLARKDLRAFISLAIEQPPKNLSARSSRSKTSQSRQDEELCENGEANSSRNSLDATNSPQCRTNTEDMQQEKPSVTSAEGCPPSKDKRISSTSATPIILAQDNHVGQDTLSPKGDDQRHVLPCGDPKVSNQDELEKANVPQSVTSLHHQPEPTPSTDVDEISDVGDSSDEEKGKSDASNYCIKFDNKQYSYPALPQMRRKKVPWTKEEEETLKEGVEKFKSTGNRIIPWKEILEFGGDRFLKGRTTVDLKDKWRNISKGSPKGK